MEEDAFDGGSQLVAELTGDPNNCQHHPRPNVLALSTQSTEKQLGMNPVKLCGEM